MPEHRYGDDRSALGCHFLRELGKLCRRYGYELSHEDRHGAFQIIKTDAPDISWISDATEIIPAKHETR